MFAGTLSSLDDLTDALQKLADTRYQARWAEMASSDRQRSLGLANAAIDAYAREAKKVCLVISGSPCAIAITVRDYARQYTGMFGPALLDARPDASDPQMEGTAARYFHGFAVLMYAPEMIVLRAPSKVVAPTSHQRLVNTSLCLSRIVARSEEVISLRHKRLTAALPCTVGAL